MSQGRGDARPGLGADGDLLPLPDGALDAPADDQPGRVALRGRAPADGRRQALQEGRERRGADLEDPADRREEVPAAERAGAPGGRVRGEAIRGRSRREQDQPEACRLISFTHLLTKPPGSWPPPLRRPMLSHDALWSFRSPATIGYTLATVHYCSRPGSRLRHSHLALRRARSLSRMKPANRGEANPSSGVGDELLAPPDAVPRECRKRFRLHLGEDKEHGTVAEHDRA